MVQSTTTLPLPPIPLEVMDFACEHALTYCLPLLLSMTRTTFPASRIEVLLEEDPEIADYRTIAFEVDVTGWSVDEMFAAHNRWTQQFIQVCPPKDAWLFRIAMVQTE